MMKFVVMAILAQIPVVSPDSLPAYPTLEEAGVYAAKRLYQCSHVYECGGVIAKRPDGKFEVGPVSSSYDGDHVGIDHSVPPGYKMVADYHSHPCLPDSHAVEFFSPQDIAGDTALRIVGFMLDECTGAVHEFTPGRDAPNDVQVDEMELIFLTRGRVVGHIVVDGKNQEPKTGLI